MNGKYKLVLLILIALGVVMLAIQLLGGNTIAVLNPKGIIALAERDLLVTAVLLMFIIVIPVFILTGVIAWRYRASNAKATYAPDHDHNFTIEFLWWALPSVIILALAVITWKSTHDLDPYKPIDSTVPPMTIQVIALRWKWLFIYPEQNIASVNFVEFPERTPIHFELTGDDTPMNSFWIPQLGGQMYAMSGMSTQLHLMANEVGEFRGSSAEISGAGFAGMKFIAKSTSQAEFDRWVALVKQSRNILSLDEYTVLAKPSENNQPVYYSSVESDLYQTNVNKYMAPMREMQMPSTTEMQMPSMRDMQM